MSDVLREFWIRAGLEEPVFTRDEVRRWPAGTFAQLMRMGLLRETDQAESVMCDNCFEAHWAEVMWTPNARSPSGMSPLIACPVEGVLDVEPERLRQWVVDLSALAMLLADSLQLSGLIEPLPGGRQWALGRRHMAGRYRDVFLVAASEGQFDVVVEKSPAPVILVPHRCGNAASKNLATFALSTVCRVKDNGLVLDVPYIEDALRTERTVVKAKTVRGFRVPQGAQWEELRLEMGDTTVTVSIRDSRQELSLEECGLTDGRQEEATGDRALQTLRLLARHNGVFFSSETTGGSQEGTPFRSQISNLRKRLQAVFPIEGNPITYHAKARCYRSAFQLRLSADAGFPTPPGATWADFHFRETLGGALLVSIKSKEVFRAWGKRSEYGTARPTTEVAEREARVLREYRLEDLRLTDRTGRATVEGQALIEFLRHSGKLGRRPDDMAVLRLRKQLQTWADMDDDPFQYNPTTRTWAAGFECASERAQ